MRTLSSKRLSLALAVIVLALAVHPGPSATRAGNGCGAAHCSFLPSVMRAPALEINAGLACFRQSPYEIVGDVVNLTGATIYSTTLSAQVYDTTGGFLGTYTSAPALPANFPGQANPFTIPTDIGYECSGEIGSFDVSVDSWSPDSPVEYRPVTVLSVALDSSGFQTVVSGDIRNDHGVSLTNIQVLVQPGTNSAFQFAGLDQTTLAPGEVAGYQTTIVHAFEPPPLSAEAQGLGQVVP